MFKYRISSLIQIDSSIMKLSERKSKFEERKDINLKTFLIILLRLKRIERYLNKLLHTFRQIIWDIFGDNENVINYI